MDDILIPELSKGLLNKEGIWYPLGKEKISYPDSGNADCLQIEDSSFWFKHRNNCIAALVKRFAAKRVFWDIGGGNGFVAKGLQSSGISTILIEPGELGAQNAAKRGVKNVICATFESAGLNDNVIKSAGLFDVLEHIEDDLKFLKSLNQTMAKDGFLFITVPAYQTLWSKDDDYAGHFRRYTNSELKKKLKNSGFKPVFSTYIFSVLIFPILIFRTIGQKLDNSAEKKVGSIDKATKDHTKEGLLSILLQPFWKFELFLTKKLLKIPFGGSCLIVAKKI
jgi:hypothetical protein